MSVTIPSVTIAVPAFNHRRYVRQTLDSMLGSGVPDLELVICDDASTDGMGEVIEEWKREHEGKFRRVVYWRHERNLGLTATLNEMIGEAQGELIQAIGSDDYFLPGGILAKALALAEHPEWWAAFCDGQAVGPDGEMFAESMVAVSEFIPAQLTPEGMGAELLYHWGNPVQQLTLRREIFKAHGGSFEYDPTVFCEDYDLALWAAGHQRLGFVPAICQGYRCRSWPQSSDRNSVREYRDNAHVLAKHAPLFPPALRREFRLLSTIHFRIATRELDCIDALWDRYHTARAEYHQRLQGGVVPVPTKGDTDGAEEILHAYRARVEELAGQLAEAKEAMQKYKVRARECGEMLAAQKSELAEARHQLRRHAANPFRALSLWWKRDRS